MDCARRARPRIRAARPCVARRVDHKGGLAVSPVAVPPAVTNRFEGHYGFILYLFLPQSVFIASRHFLLRPATAGTAAGEAAGRPPYGGRSSRSRIGSVS